MKTRFAQLVPPRHITGRWVAIALVLWGVSWLGLLDAHNIQAVENGRGMRFFVLVALAAIYGLYRGGFHPVSRPAYERWLALSPWTPAQPLPMGPVQLVWEDVVIAAVIALPGLCERIPTLHPSWHELAGRMAWIPAALVIGYIFVAIITLSRVGKGYYAVAILFLAPVTIFFLDDAPVTAWLDTPAAFGTVLAACYVVAWIGLRQSLQHFPWNTTFWKQSTMAGLIEAARAQGKAWPGVHTWPIESKRPGVPVKAIVGGALVAWYVYLAVAIGGVKGMLHSEELGWMAWVSVLVTALAVRYLCYIFRRRPPLTVLGRFRRMRLVIPGYDRAWWAIWAIGVIGLFLPVVFNAAGLNDVGTPIASIFLIIVIATWMPPRLQAWQFTGQCSVVVPKAQAQATRVMRQPTGSMGWGEEEAEEEEAEG